MRNSLCFEEEVIEGINVDVDRRRSSWEERSPLPSVVFSVEKEICADNRDTNGDDDENQEDQKHETIDIVDFVGPEGCEDEVPANRIELDNELDF